MRKLKVFGAYKPVCQIGDKIKYLSIPYEVYDIFRYTAMSQNIYSLKGIGWSITTVIESDLVKGMQP